MEVHINQLCSQGQLTDAVGIDPAKKKENESCIFLVVFYLQLYFEVAFFRIYVVFLIPVKAHSLYLVPRLQIYIFTSADLRLHIFTYYLCYTWGSVYFN